MKKIVMALTAASLLTASINALSAETTHTGRFVTIPSVAFKGEPDKSHGWPVKVDSFDEAIENARKWGINAFHLYVSGDKEPADMYPSKTVIGYEHREGRQNVGVIMERTSVHQ